MHVTRFRPVIALLLALCLMAGAVPAVAESQPIGLLLDGKPVTMDVPPVIVSGRTLVPLRAIMEALGARVEWDQATRTATVQQDGHTVVLPEGSRKATVDGSEVTLDVPAQILSGRMLVPVRFLVEATGGEVDWLAAENTVVLAVRDEDLKTQLRLVKTNRELPATPPRLSSISGELGFRLQSPARDQFASDGKVHLAGQIAERLNGGHIVVDVMGPQQRSRETTLPVTSGTFSGDISLAEGTGSYYIRIYAPRNAGDEGVYLLTSLSVKNVSPKSRQYPYYSRSYAQSGIALDLPSAGQIAVDTALPLRGAADQKLNGRYVWLQAEKDGKTWSSYAAIKDGRFAGEAHLGGGPGLHWVTLLVQDETGTNRYVPLAAIPVMNTSIKAARQPTVVNPAGLEAALQLAPMATEVQDGTLTVQGNVDPARQLTFLWVKVNREGESDDIHLPVADGRFAGQVPLALGPGEYDVSFLIPLGGITWQEAAHTRVTSQAVHVVRGFRYTTEALAQKLVLITPTVDPVAAETMLTVAGTVQNFPQSHPYVTAIARYGTEEAQYRLPIKDGAFTGDVHLRFGPGTYEVILYTQVGSFQLRELVRFTATTDTAPDLRDLLPSWGVESDHPDIVALSRELTSGKAPMEAGRAVFEWVAQNIRYDRLKAAAWRIDPDEGAERTLRTGTGVCRDYAALAVALLRATGIRAHMVTGQAGSGYAASGHAWVEFHDGTRWVEMDPTFASGVVSGTEFVPQYDARYFDPAPAFLKATHTREGIQY